MYNYVGELLNKKKDLECRIEGIERSVYNSHNKQKKYEFFDILCELREELNKIRSKINFAMNLRMEMDYELLHKEIQSRTR